ncbi:hypothetical protein SRRS_40210 [Sporomusa rhizae]
MKEKPVLCYGDVNNVQDIVAAMKDVSVVLHLYNIRHSPNIIQACNLIGIKRVIFVNTTGMYSKFQQYANLYKKLEKNILESGLDYTIIRPTMIYGNQQDKNISKLVKIASRLRVFPIIGEGKSLLQPIFAGDLAEAIYQASQRDVSIHKTYNVAGSEPLSYEVIIKAIYYAMNKEVRFIHIPYKLALVAGKIGDILPNGLISTERLLRLSEDKCFNYSNATEDLGFIPKSFYEGIRLEVECIKAANII